MRLQLYVLIPSIDSLFNILYRFDRILNEMLSHLERQPRNKERRVAWLRYVEPLFNGVGLVLLAHLRHIFPLFFKWMHADDDETVLLVSIYPSVYVLKFCIFNKYLPFTCFCRFSNRLKQL